MRGTWAAVAGTAGLLLLGGATEAPAQERNEIRGRIEYSNSNPEVLAVLDDPAGQGLERILVWLTPESGRATVTVTFDAEQRTGADYELSVEAGLPGLVHEVGVSSYQPGPPYGYYRFLPRESPPVEPEPAPDALLDFQECAGLIRVRFVDPDGAAREVEHARVEASDERTAFARDAQRGDTVLFLPVRGDGTAFDLSAEITLGVGDTGDSVRVSREVVMGVACDEIRDWEITLPALDDLGRFVGRFDLLGVEELAAAGPAWPAATRVEAWGPVSNYRRHDFLEMPAHGAFELPNLLPSSHFAEPSSYFVQAHAGFRAGPSFQALSTARVQQDLPALATVDLGQSFVMTPAWFDGELILHAPVADPVDSPFLDLLLSADESLPLGFPLALARVSYVRLEGSPERVPGASRAAAPAETLGWLEGSFGPSGRSFAGEYELAVAQPDGEPGRFRQERLELRWEDGDTPDRPETYIDERLLVSFEDEEHDLWPGDRQAVRQELCMGEVRLVMRAEEGPVFSPRATFEGSFSGLDGSGQPIAYGAVAGGQGTPRGESEAGDEAQVNLYLPEGEYDAWASLLAVTDDAGYASVTSWNHEALTVLCGQVLEPQPGLSVRLDEALPDCSGAAVVAVSGSVASELDVARLAWSISGGSETVLCEPCGRDPSFAFDAPLGERDSWVRVRAVDAAGGEAAVRSVTRHAPEPSALDRDPAAEPLRVTRPAATRIRLSWERPAHDRFNVYEGTLDSLWAADAYDHRRLGTCEREEAELAFRPPPGDLYYLVSSNCGGGEGSYGRDSLGVERPEGVNACP